MALGSKQAHAAMANFIRNYKLNTKVTPADRSQADTKSYLVELNQVKNLKLPGDIAARGDIESHLQAVCNLFDGTKFIGRTYCGQVTKLDENLALVGSDYVVVNSKAEKLSLVVEFLLVVKEVI